MMDHSPESTVIRYTSSSYHHISDPAPSSPGLGIRIAVKPELRMNSPPQLAQVRDIPRGNFQFDFELERKILAEIENGCQNSSSLGLENLLSKTAESTSSPGSSADPAISQTGNYGDDSTNVVLQYIHSVVFFKKSDQKAAQEESILFQEMVREFANGYIVLKEMGFSSNNVPEALLMFDNDTDKALAHCLNGSS